MTDRCSYEWWSGYSQYPLAQCSKDSEVVGKDGKPYCAHHEPEKMLARRLKAREARRRKRRTVA